MPVSAAGLAAASQSWTSRDRNAGPAGADSSTSRPPVSPYQPMADATIRVAGGWPSLVSAPASARVPSIRLALISALYLAVQRWSATPAPARWTQAPSPSSADRPAIPDEPRVPGEPRAPDEARVPDEARAPGQRSPAAGERRSHRTAAAAGGDRRTCRVASLPLPHGLAISGV